MHDGTASCPFRGGRQGRRADQGPDVEAALAKAESLGGTRVMGPETIMEGITLGQFLDLEGRLVGLTQAAG
ncbi:MAG: VOC family protein [Solirubrobacterales bacterium]